jgi:glc operon protein GlcG
VSDSTPLETVTLAASRRTADAALEEAASLGVSVVVAITDAAGELKTLARMDGSPLLSVGVAQDKAWTVSAFGIPTHAWEQLLRDEPSLAALGSGRRLMPVPGGVPLVVADRVVGGIGVSGASSEQDRWIAEAGASAVG